MKKKLASGSRRDALVEAAFYIIAKEGFEGLRLREVASKAGIDHSTLHHHFHSKRDLIAAVLEYATKQFRPTLPANDASPSSLHEHLTFLSRMIVDRPEVHVVLREFDLHATRDARVRAIITEREAGWRERVAARIRIAATTGLWPPQIDPTTGAELVIAVIKGASFNPKRAAELVQSFEQLLVQTSTRKTSQKERS
jgi:AcrR family transcriptional regulator